MSTVADASSLEAWLRDRPPEVACALASRASLRVAPMLVEALHCEAADRRAAVLLPSFRALATARFAGTWPMRTGEILSAARVAKCVARDAVAELVYGAQMGVIEATEAVPEESHFVFDLEADVQALRVAEYAVSAATHAVQAAIDAVDAAKGIGSSAAALEAAIAGVQSAHDAVDGVHGFPRLHAAVEGGVDEQAEGTHIGEFWTAVSLDAELLAGEGTDQPLDFAGLSRRPLWLDNPPIWVGRRWADLRDVLPEEEGWSVWIDWYEACLTGRSADEALEFAQVTVSEQDWDQGPAQVNAILLRQIAAPPDPITEALTRGLEEVGEAKDDLTQFTTRIRDSLPNDPSQAIGATKEMLEATMKTILHRRGREVGTLPFPQLTARCLEELGLTSKAAPSTEGEKCLRRIASNARKMIEAANDLRNRAGTGHGRILGVEPGVMSADASLVASTGLILAAWMLRHEERL